MPDVFCAHTEMVDIEKVIPNPRNPNKHPDKQIAMLAKIIDAQGWRAPITVSNRSGFIVRGHGRLMAARKLGLAQVPVDYQDYESEAAEWADLIADNRLSELSDPDVTMLKDLLQEIDTGAIDMELTAYTADEIEAMINGDKQAEEDNFDADAALNEIEEPTTKPGDIYLLGNHRLMCGDSTDKDAFETLTAETDLEIVYTDPPYSSGGYQESGKTSGSIGARGGKKIETDNLSIRGYISLMDKVLALSRKAHTVFIFCDWKMWATNQDIAEAKGYRVRNMIVWNKCQMGMGMPFRNQHELCLFGSKLAGKIGDGKTPNVISVPRDRESEHATPKPIELIMQMLNQIDGGVVFDPFGGSGSTLIACEQLNRRCYMMELDPKYCDVIVKRWETLTGNKAELLRR